MFGLFHVWYLVEASKGFPEQVVSGGCDVKPVIGFANRLGDGDGDVMAPDSPLAFRSGIQKS